MSKGFRQSQAALHTWSGLLLGWVLFIIFSAGSAAYWREELNRWARPELPRIVQREPVIVGAVRYLSVKAPDAESWRIILPGPRSPGALVSWQPKPNDGEEPRKRRRNRDNETWIDAEGKPATVRDTRGGDFFYRFHFDLHYVPVIWARWIVSIAAMFMLVAILTGIVTHKKIFKDFFTLRRGKGQRSWLDGHNATAVLALPFHLMITYTGLVTLVAMLMPWAVIANYEKSETLFDTLFPSIAESSPTGRPARLTDVSAVLRDAERRFGAPAGSIEIVHPGDAAARITLRQTTSSMLSVRTPSLTYDGTSGALLWQSPPPGEAAVTQGAMVGLHAGRFADYPMRWLYFLAGISGALMVASGLVLWTVKRRERLPDPARPPFGFRLVERLNIAVIAGFPIAMCAFLWANRLLPPGTVKRADAEIDAMFLCWAAIFVFASLRQPRRAWIELLSLAALMLAALPVLNIASGQAGLTQTVPAGDWVLATADLTLAALGAGFAYAARHMLRRKPKAPARRRDASSPVRTAENPLAMEPAE